MVKIGFICEGETEKLVVDSDAFQEILVSFKLDFVGSVNADGNGNLLPKNIIPHTKTLERLGAEITIILTDLDEDACITKTKERIHPNELAEEGIFQNQIILVSVKQIEAWFLADSKTLSKLFKSNFEFSNPEEEQNPFQTLKNLFVEKTSRGIGSFKPKFARKMLNNGFSIVHASQHSSCESARYFLNKLKGLGEK